MLTRLIGGLVFEGVESLTRSGRTSGTWTNPTIGLQQGLYRDRHTEIRHDETIMK